MRGSRRSRGPSDRSPVWPEVRSRAGLHTLECVMRFGGKAHYDAIPRHDPAACYHDAHDPGLAHHLAVAIASKNGVEQTWLESIDLSAWVAQPGDLDDCLGPNTQLRAAGQCEQVQIPGGDVLAKLTPVSYTHLRAHE